MIGTWKAYLYDKSDSFIAELPFEGLDIEFKLNDIWTANIRVNYLVLKKYADKQATTIPTMIAAGFRYVDIKRNDVTIFKGILSETSIQKFEYDININLTFKGWLAYFQKRFISKSYTATDAGAIAWDQINTAQGITYGSIGVTQGTIDTTVNRDRTYRNDEIAKNLMNLSNSSIDGGFECEISNTKVFSVRTRLGSDKLYLVFDKSNIKSYQIDYSLGLNMTNKVIALGEGYGDAQLSVTRNSSSSYQNAWYLLEELASFMSVKEQATLEAHGDKQLTLKQDVTKMIGVTVSTNNIPVTDYDVGDTVKVEIEDLINASYRIKTKQISLNQGEEQVKLDFIY